MRNIPIEHILKIKKSLPLIKSKIKVKIFFKAKKLFIDGEELNEFVAEKIINSIDFGFDPEDALILLNPDFSLNFINIKEYTKKHNLKPVRSRVIGTDGRAKGTIEELTGSRIIINDNLLGIIADSENLTNTIQALISLIQGAKHANVFSYLEKQNIIQRKLNSDLGLKDETNKL